MIQGNILIQTIPCVVYLLLILINPSIFDSESPGWILLLTLFVLVVSVLLIIKTLIQDSMFFFTGLVTCGFLYYNLSTVVLILLDPQGMYILHSAIMFACIILPPLLYTFYIFGLQVVSLFKRDDETEDSVPENKKSFRKMFFLLAAGAAASIAVVYYFSGSSGPKEFIAANAFFIYLYWFIDYTHVFDVQEEEGSHFSWMVILFVFSAAVTGGGLSLTGQILFNSVSGGLIDAVIISGCALMFSFAWYLVLVLSGVLFLNNRHNDSGLISLIVNGGIISGGAFFLLHEGMISELIGSYKYYLLISLVLIFYIVASLLFAHTGGSLISKINKKLNRG